MVKSRISATVDEKTIKIIEKILSKGKYRNKSHVIEKAIKLLEETEKWIREHKSQFLLFSELS